MDRQRSDRRRRLLVPVAPDGRSARCGRPGRLRPDHRRAVDRGRQEGGRHVLPAVPGVAGIVQQHPARAHRQGRAGRFRGRAGERAAGHRRTVPGRKHRPAARRDPARPQRSLLGAAGQAGPDPVPARRGAGRAGRFGPQRRHSGGPSTRWLSGFRAVVGHPRCADRPDRDAASHAADVARQRAQAGRLRRCARRFWECSTSTCSPPSARAATTPSAWIRRRFARPAIPAMCRPRRRR